MRKKLTAAQLKIISKYTSREMVNNNFELLKGFPEYFKERMLALSAMFLRFNYRLNKKLKTQLEYTFLTDLGASIKEDKTLDKNTVIMEIVLSHPEIKVTAHSFFQKHKYWEDLGHEFQIKYVEGVKYKGRFGTWSDDEFDLYII